MMITLIEVRSDHRRMVVVRVEGGWLGAYRIPALDQLDPGSSTGGKLPTG